MPRKKISTGAGNETAELLKDILIVQLGTVGIPQQTIRKIVGCNMNRVTRIVKHLKTSKKQTKKKRS